MNHSEEEKQGLPDQQDEYAGVRQAYEFFGFFGLLVPMAILVGLLIWAIVTGR